MAEADLTEWIRIALQGSDEAARKRLDAVSATATAWEESERKVLLELIEALADPALWNSERGQLALVQARRLAEGKRLREAIERVKAALSR